MEDKEVQMANLKASASLVSKFSDYTGRDEFDTEDWYPKNYLI